MRSAGRPAVPRPLLWGMGKCVSVVVVFNRLSRIAVRGEAMGGDSPVMPSFCPRLIRVIPGPGASIGAPRGPLTVPGGFLHRLGDR